MKIMIRNEALGWRCYTCRRCITGRCCDYAKMTIKFIVETYRRV